jgi:hypothetical protein
VQLATYWVFLVLALPDSAAAVLEADGWPLAVEEVEMQNQLGLRAVIRASAALQMQ